MNIIRILLLRAFVLVILISSFVYLTYGKEGPSVVHIMRNVAWNDFITQIKFLPDDSPQDFARQRNARYRRLLASRAPCRRSRSTCRTTLRMTLRRARGNRRGTLGTARVRKSR